MFMSVILPVLNFFVSCALAFQCGQRIAQGKPRAHFGFGLGTLITVLPLTVSIRDFPLFILPLLVDEVCLVTGLALGMLGGFKQVGTFFKEVWHGEEREADAVQVRGNDSA